MGWEGRMRPGTGCSNGRMGCDIGKETWDTLSCSPSAQPGSREHSQGWEEQGLEALVLQLHPCCLPGPAHPWMGSSNFRALRGVGSSGDGNALAVLGLGRRGWVERGEHPVSTAPPAQPQHTEPMFRESWRCPCPVLPHTRAHPEPPSSPNVPSPAEPGLKPEPEVLQTRHSLLTCLQGALSFPSLNQVTQVLPIRAPLPWRFHPGHGTHSCTQGEPSILTPPNAPAPRVSPAS